MINWVLQLNNSQLGISFNSLFGEAPRVKLSKPTQSKKNPQHIDFSVPRRAQYLYSAWRRHQDVVFWGDIDLAIRKGLKFYQTRSNAIIPHETLPACRIPKVVRTKTGEVLYKKVYMSPRPPPKISSKHEWKRQLGSEHAQRPEVGQLSSQPSPNPSLERTERPVVETSVIPTRSSEDSKDPNVEKTHERTRRLVVETKQTQKMCQIVAKHVLVMKAKHSTLENTS